MAMMDFVEFALGEEVGWLARRSMVHGFRTCADEIFDYLNYSWLLIFPNSLLFGLLTV